MARTIRTEIRIGVPPERVWSVLTDFPAYPSWNPFIRAAEGRPSVGERLRITLQSSPGSTMRFRPRVLVATAPSELRWLGRLGLPGLFDGEHRFGIEPDGSGGSVFSQSETFRGLLVPLLWPGLGPRTEAAFHRMNEALRDRVEPPRQS